MKRRSFLRNSAMASGTFLVPSFVRAMTEDLLSVEGFKKLVIIQLTGGNDGLNTVVPYLDDRYYKSRPSLAMERNGLLRLEDGLGLHPELKPLMELYDRGELTIVNNVGYPNPSRSHFRSTDIWHTASGSEEYLKEGWLGRYLDSKNASSHHIIEIGNSLSLMMKGKEKSGIVLQNAGLLKRLASDPYFDHILANSTDTHLSEHNMGYLYRTMINARQSASYIYEKSRVFQSNIDYGKSAFGRQLKTVAEFINSGLDTTVYYASLSGFDTHASQKGKQARLLGIYAQSVGALVNDLKQNDTFKDTLILTFSEFGRRVAQNAGGGTDHGAANNVFVMGSNLAQPGLYNEGPDLGNLDDNGDIRYDIDFRSIYANILEKWLSTDPGKIISTPVPELFIV